MDSEEAVMEEEVDSGDHFITISASDQIVLKFFRYFAWKPQQWLAF